MHSPTRQPRWPACGCPRRRARTRAGPPHLEVGRCASEIGVRRPGRLLQLLRVALARRRRLVALRERARANLRAAPRPDPLAPAHVAPESGPHALAVCTALALAPAGPRPQVQAPGAGDAGTPAAPPPGCALVGPNPNPSPGKQGRGAAPWAASPGRRRSCRRCRPSAPGAARPGASAGSAAHQAAAAQRSPAAPLHPPSQQRSEQLHCVAHCAQSA